MDELDISDAKAAAKEAAKPALDIKKARIATSEEVAKKADDAARVAEANKDVAEDLIILFEDETGKTISRTGADGRLVIDFDKARKAGVETAEEIAEAQRGSVRQILAGSADVNLDAAQVAGQFDTITDKPLLKPEKFDGLVAVISDLIQKARPDAFKRKVNTSGPRKGKEYSVIDHLFELTVQQDLDGNPTLLGV